MGCGGSTEAGQQAAAPEVTKLDGCELKKLSAVVEGEYAVIDGAACKVASAKTIPTKQGDVTYLKGEDVFTGGLKIVKLVANSDVNVPEVKITSYTMNDADVSASSLMPQTSSNAASRAWPLPKGLSARPPPPPPHLFGQPSSAGVRSDHAAVANRRRGCISWLAKTAKSEATLAPTTWQIVPNNPRT